MIEDSKVDFIMKWLLVIEINTILVVCNKLSKIIHFIVTIKEILVRKVSCLCILCLLQTYLRL